MTDSISPGKHRLETRTPPQRFVSLALIACVLAAVSILVLSPIGTQQAFAAADGKNNPGYVVNTHPGQATTINLIDYLPKGGDLPPADDEGFSFSVTTAEAPLSANVDPSGLLTLSIPSTATVGGTCSMELSIKSTTESTQHYYIYQFTVRVVHKVDSFNVERDRYALYDGTPPNKATRLPTTRLQPRTMTVLDNGLVQPIRSPYPTAMEPPPPLPSPYFRGSTRQSSPYRTCSPTSTTRMPLTFLAQDRFPLTSR